MLFNFGKGILGRNKQKEGESLPDAKQRRREAVVKSVRRNSSGSVQLRDGKFVTRADKNLDTLDID